VLLLALTACGGRGDDAGRTPPSAPNEAAPSDVTESWLGQWNGPEGTYLLLSKEGGRWMVTIQSLDGPQTYEGVAAGGDHLEFERDGKLESIRAASGQQTGMKWLLEKSDCLMIRTGEGFCRD
jgi:hypothetical protein